MKINPAMVRHLLRPQNPTYADTLSGTFLLIDSVVDIAAFTTWFKSKGFGATSEKEVRTYLIETFGSATNLAEFRMANISITDSLDVDTYKREYELIFDPASAVFTNAGTALGFVFLLKEEDASVYNTNAVSTETIVGTVGKVGDVDVKDLMLTDNVIDASSELVKNNLTVSIKC